MPEFAPGESKVAVATFPVKPAGLPCTAELWLGSDSAKVATSGEVPFIATGTEQSITLPVIMPDIEGTYPVNLDVFSNGQLIGAYQALEDVVVVVVEPVTIDSLRVRYAGGIVYGQLVITNHTNQTFPHTHPGGSFYTFIGAQGFIPSLNYPAVNTVETYGSPISRTGKLYPGTHTFSGTKSTSPPYQPKEGGLGWVKATFWSVDWDKDISLGKADQVFTGKYSSSWQNWTKTSWMPVFIGL